MISFPVHALPAALTVAAAMLLVSACGQGSGGQGSGDEGPAGPGATQPSGQLTPGYVPPALFHAALSCPSGTDVLVLQRVPIVLAHEETVVVARCDSGAGSPPTGVFVVDGAGSKATVTATLVGPSAQVEIESVTATRDRLRASGMGYSSPDVPRCCPDRRVDLVWRIDGSHLIAAS